MKLKTAVLGLSLLLGASVSTLGTAETTDEDMLNYRVSIMTALRGHMGAASMIIRGMVEDRGQLAGHARAMAEGVDEFTHIFPAGSNINDSRSLDAIWEKPEEFATAIEKSRADTLAFAEVAAGGDLQASRSAFMQVGRSCKGCHDTFRRPKD